MERKENVEICFKMNLVPNHFWSFPSPLPGVFLSSRQRFKIDKMTKTSQILEKDYLCLPHESEILAENMYPFD